MFKAELIQSVQYVTDAAGTRKAVLLDIDIWKKILQILPNPLWSNIEESERIVSNNSDSDLQQKIAMMMKAPNDPLFMADLEETMSDFAHIDSEWWERDQ